MLTLVSLGSSPGSSLSGLGGSALASLGGLSTSAALLLHSASHFVPLVTATKLLLSPTQPSPPRPPSPMLPSTMLPSPPPLSSLPTSLMLSLPPLPLPSQLIPSALAPSPSACPPSASASAAPSALAAPLPSALAMPSASSSASARGALLVPSTSPWVRVTSAAPSASSCAPSASSCAPLPLACAPSVLARAPSTDGPSRLGGSVLDSLGSSALVHVASLCSLSSSTTLASFSDLGRSALVRSLLTSLGNLRGSVSICSLVLACPSPSSPGGLADRSVSGSSPLAFLFSASSLPWAQATIWPGGASTDAQPAIWPGGAATGLGSAVAVAATVANVTAVDAAVADVATAATAIADIAVTDAVVVAAAIADAAVVDAAVTAIADAAVAPSAVSDTNASASACAASSVVRAPPLASAHVLPPASACAPQSAAALSAAAIVVVAVAAIAVAAIVAFAVSGANSAIATAAVANAAADVAVTEAAITDPAGADTAVTVLAICTACTVAPAHEPPAACILPSPIQLSPPRPPRPPSPSPLAPARSAMPYNTPADLDTWVQVDALQWLFGSPRSVWPPGLESHCLRVLCDHVAMLASDLADTGYTLDDQTLMAAVERHMPDSCSGLRIVMRCPYPLTFRAYADGIVELASLSVKATVYRDAVQRLETSILPPEAPVDVLSLHRQIDFTLAAAADWSRAMDGRRMDDCLLQFYLARALPISYAPLRITVRRVAPSTFGDYCAMLIALASVDTARLSRGLPALSGDATDAFDYLRGLQDTLLTLPPPQSPQLPLVSSLLPSPMLPLPSPTTTLQSQTQLSPILPLSPSPMLQTPTLLSPLLESPLTPALTDDASPATPVAVPADAPVTIVADAAVVTVAFANVAITVANTAINPIIWPGGVSNRLCPPRHQLVRLRHWPMRRGHRPVRSASACSTTDRTVPSASTRHCPLTLSAHRSPLHRAHPIVISNLRACPSG